MHELDCYNYFGKYKWILHSFLKRSDQLLYLRKGVFDAMIYRYFILLVYQLMPWNRTYLLMQIKMQEPPIKHPLGQPQKSNMQLSQDSSDTTFRLQISGSLHAQSQLICSTIYIMHEILSQFNSRQCFGYIFRIIHHPMKK